VRTRPALHEDEAEVGYYETETENFGLEARWPRGLNIVTVAAVVIGVSHGSRRTIIQHSLRYRK